MGARVNIDDLFIAGILPGTLMLVLLVGYCMLQTRQDSTTLKAFSRVEAWRALRAAMPEIPLPFIVLGGIYGGYLAVSEAAAVTAFYVLLVEVAIKREIEWSAVASGYA